MPLEARPFRLIRNLGRSREIMAVLLNHGFGDLVDRVGIRDYWYRWRRRFSRKGHHPAPLRHVTTVERIRRTLEDLGPTFIKFGQVMSTRPDLVPPPMIAELQQLQEGVPPFPSELAIANDRLLRLQAEMQNLRNRTSREIADERKYAALPVIRDLLPVVDNIDRAIEAAQAAGNKRGVADGHHHLGWLFLCRRDWERAVGALQKAARLFQEIGADGSVVWVTTDLGCAYLAQGDREARTSEC